MARAGPSSARQAASKPYDRPITAPPAYTLKYRGTGKTKPDVPSARVGEPAPSSLPGRVSIGGKAVTLDVGAPATVGQTSRKGKKAWRKNIDLRDVEGALEEARTEERITGSVV
jgi:nucleolar protein 53